MAKSRATQQERTAVATKLARCELNISEKEAESRDLLKRLADEQVELTRLQNRLKQIDANPRKGDSSI
jgi:hypothetical protein